MSERRVRFVAAKEGLAPNAPWGVWDYLGKLWAVKPKMSKADADERAEEMDSAARGRGR